MGDKLMAVAWDVNGIREDIQLVSVLGSGGEGDVYITDTPGIVAKIYKLSKNPSEAKATENKYNKVRKLIDMRLQCEGVCFPLKMVTSRDGRFIGYTMTQAKGDTLSDVIHPMVIKNEFPNMERLQLVDICIDTVSYTHLVFSALMFTLWLSLTLPLLTGLRLERRKMILSLIHI